MTASTSTDGHVDYGHAIGGVATISLNRPSKLNAINGHMMRALWKALDEFYDDEWARVAILRAEGRAFCVGADIHDASGSRRRDPAEDLARITEAFLVRDNPKPLIASMHGHVVGAGLRLSLLSDFTICAESTRFRAPEVVHGLNAGFFWTMIQAGAGDAFAMDVVATGRTWSGQEAEQRGLVTRCVPDLALPDATAELAAALATQPPGALTALVETRRAALRRLDHDSWLSRGRGLGWSDAPVSKPADRPTAPS